MKVIALTLLIQATSILTPQEEQAVLKAIDNICGDTWCEGESNWSFDKLDCTTDKGCVLDLTMKPYNFMDEPGLSSRPLQCHLPEFVTKESIIEETNWGLTFTWDFYEAVNRCINEDLEPNYGPLYVPLDTACPSLWNSSSSFQAFQQPATISTSGSYAAASIIAQLISRLATEDARCKLEWQAYYRDQVKCQKLNEDREICLVPSAQGAFQVIWGGGEDSIVIYTATN